MQRLLSQIGRSQRLEVVNLLKRSSGLTVRELASKLDMSYMGVKQICIDLHKDGYLETTRRHHGVGRPELVYHLTNKTQDLFPKADNALALSLLEEARRLFGAGAAEKLLFRHFQARFDDYSARLRGESVEERAKWLVRFRDNEGHMAELEAGPPLRIIERHHPMQSLLEAYPTAVDMEREMMQRLLGVTIRREKPEKAGAYFCAFVVG